MGNRGGLALPRGSLLPWCCCQPDGVIGAETPPGTCRAAPALLGAGGAGGGLGSPFPTVPTLGDLLGWAPASQAAAPTCSVDKPKALLESSMQEKQLLGRNLVRAGWVEGAVSAFGFIPAVQNHTAGAGW